MAARRKLRHKGLQRCALLTRKLGLAPYAVNVQVKTEVHRKGASANEEADLARLITILREAHYSGYVVLEYEVSEDPLSAIPRHIKKLRELIR